MDIKDVTNMQTLGTVIFACAVIHTFVVKKLRKLSHHFRPNSVGDNIFHFLGEVEVVFGLWAATLIIVWALRYGMESATVYLNSINFTEPAFVFVIMAMAATKPVVNFARLAISAIAHILPLKQATAFYIATLVVGPLLGSLITEPAAMTVTALLLKERFFDDPRASPKFLYATLGLLFVNISIGGTLTHFAAPPVIMVAGPWNWDLQFMLTTFGWRAFLSILIGVLGTAMFLRKQLQAMNISHVDKKIHEPSPLWLILSHLVFMGLVVTQAHHMTVFIPIFLFFLGWAAVTKEYQDGLRLRESLLVAFFLGGLVTLGKLQGWWIQPVLESLGAKQLFAAAAALTAVTDNAAITYLGTLVANLTDEAKFALVAGAVTGGGLTVIANAPNPAGLSILQSSFGEDGISPLGLFIGALPFTIISAVFFLI